MDMSKLELTLEQQPNLAVYKQHREGANEEQLRELLYEAMKLICVKDNIIRELVREVKL